MDNRIERVYVPMTETGFYIFDREEEKRRLYRITELGEEVLERELRRIERLYRNSRGEKYDG